MSKGERIYLQILSAVFILSLLIAIVFALRIVPDVSYGPPEGITSIKIDGVISFSGDGFESSSVPVDELSSFIRKQASNPLVKGFLIRVNSPGGTLGAVQELYSALQYARRRGKKIVVTMGDVAASGGYYISCASDEIVAYPGTITGSIGVIMWHLSFEGAMQRYGITYEAIKTGRYKDALNHFQNLSPSERAYLERVVLDAFKDFLKVVSLRRLKVPLDRVADGRIFTGRQAQKLGLIDEIGDLEVAAGELRKLTSVKFSLPFRRVKREIKGEKLGLGTWNMKFYTGRTTFQQALSYLFGKKGFPYTALPPGFGVGYLWMGAF